MQIITRRVVSICASLVWLHTAALWAQPFDSAPSTLRVMSWNVEWLFDANAEDNVSQLAREQSSPSVEHWEHKLAGVAQVIATCKPDIVALQEIEGKQSLIALAEQLKTTHQLTYRYAFIEGNDTFTEQDVGVLQRSGLVAFRRHEQSKAMFDSQQYYNVSKHLVCQFRWRDVESPLTVINVHLRATPEAEPLRERQSRLLRQWMSPELNAGQDVIMLGDFNSEYVASGESPASDARGEVAVILGQADSPPMIDLLSQLSDPQQPTHLILKKQFDRIFVSPSLMVDGPGEDWKFDTLQIITEGVVRGERDGPEHWQKRLSSASADLEQTDVSDHLPIMATFSRN
jgi:endonuclease/exonuclease/phosphatase family metal-dependent hydrolase